jgi:hypothetical protein
MNEAKRWFITVDWCSQGKRGIFCDAQGNCMVKDRQHTMDEIGNALGVFEMILDPKSEEMSIDEVAQYTRWIPLAEYSHQWGIATVPE